MTASLLKYFAPSDQPLVKVVGASADGDKTIVYVLPTPLGSPQKKDLHEEFFMPETYYGDDHIKTRYGLYEHLLNDHNNPVMAEMGVQKQILGAATLLTEEQKKDAGLSVAERWYALEIKRSLEYHDMLMNMVDAKMMGASTQCFMNGKRKNADGGITMWLENEISLTPTPAHPGTIGIVANAVKSYNTVKSATAPLLPKLMLVKNGQLVEVDLDAPVATLEAPVVSPEPAPVAAEVGDVASQIEAILSDEEVPADTTVTLDAKTLRSVIADEIEKSIAPLKASMSIMLDMWGSTPEDAVAQRQALLTMLGMMPEMQKSVKGLELGMVTIAKAMKTQKQAGIQSTVSPRELEVLTPPPANTIPAPKAKIGVPEHLRLEAK